MLILDDDDLRIVFKTEKVFVKPFFDVSTAEIVLFTLGLPVR